MTDLARRALAVNRALLALANETFAADGATLVRNRSLPDIRDANHVTNVVASGLDETDRLLGRVEREFAGLAYRRFDLDFTTPPAFEARLLLDGYERSDTLVLVLEDELAGPAQPHDIRPITDEAGWQARAALNEAGWGEYTERIGRPEEMQAALRSGRDKAPPMRYWLAYLDGEARAYCASWGGIDGVGQVEYLFTHPQSRHRGLATALIHRCVAACREQGAGPVVITASASDTPKEMYAAMGFRPVAVKREYGKDVGA